MRRRIGALVLGGLSLALACQESAPTAPTSVTVALQPTAGAGSRWFESRPRVPGPTSWSVATTLSVGLYGVWGSGPYNIFALSTTLGSIAHYDARGWSVMSSGTANGLNSIWGVSRTSVYASGGNFAGTTNIQHYNGTSWTSLSNVPSCQYISGIWGLSDSDLFAVCTDGSIFHYNGSSWSSMTSPTSGRFEKMWGASDNSVFAVGDGGLIAQYDGTSWSVVSTPTTVNLYWVWGTSATDVFATGDGGVILHFDGTTWTEMPSGTTLNLSQVWGTSHSNVVTVGAEGVILHYNGTAWAPMTSGTTEQLYGVWASSPTHFVATGASGLVLVSR